MTDEEILTALRGGNQLVQSRAVDALLKQMEPALVHYVKQNSGTREEGRMMANEAVVALWKALHAGKYTQRDGVKMSTWCITVGRNLWLKELRGRKVRGDNRTGGHGNEPMESSTPLDLLTDMEDHTMASAEVQRAWRAFKMISIDCQRLFQADLEDRPEEEIMQQLGMSNLGSVKVKRHRCKEKWITLYRQETPVTHDGVRV